MSKTKVMIRLRPLYAAAFFHGFVLWYPIEKIFMKSIGFNDASIGLMIAVYSAVMLLAETPSGILADRWSRKGVLVLASLALFMSALIGGLSYSTEVFLLSTCMWGVYFALYSGTYESIIYDTVLEETKSSNLYEKLLGRMKIIDSIALVLGSLLGGVVSGYLGTRWAFFLTIPSTFFAIIALMKFQEPLLHKKEVAAPIKEHIVNTFKAVFKKGYVALLVIVLVLGSTLMDSLFEFSQLWFIALLAPTILFGPLNAVLLSTLGIGGYIADRLNPRSRQAKRVLIVALLVATLGLIFSRNLAVIIVSMSVLAISLVCINIAFLKLLHDVLPSNVRAGAGSAVSTVSRMIIIPLSLILGVISENANIFNAAWVFFGLALLTAAFILKTYHTRAPNKPVKV